MRLSKLLTAAVLALSALTLAGCGGDDRGSADGTLAAARKAVEKGRADRLGTFIYAESPDERRLMNRFGVMLGNLQKLGDAVQQRFPKEVADLKAKAEEAAKNGKAASLMSQITSQVRPQSGRRQRPTQEEMKARERAFGDALTGVFADPYGWLRESETRLTTTYLTDDSVALLWDNKPVMAPIGMVMKKSETDGKWYFVLPTNLPVVSKFMPRTKEQFEIWGGMIKVFDNTIIDLRKDVEQGRVSSIEDLSRRAGEKALVPAMMVVLAYGKLEDIQKKQDKAAKQPVSDNTGIEPPKDLSKIPEVSPEELEKMKQGK